MMKLVDYITYAFALIAVFVAGIGPYVILNVLTRPETISIALELPQPKGVVTMWDPIDTKEGLGGPPSWYKDYEAEIHNDYYNPYLFSNKRTYTKAEHVCMAKNIYFEARHESLKGQLLVALVTLERVEDPRWPSNICDVVYEHKQFSWYSDGLSDNVRNYKLYNEITLLTSAVLSPETGLEDFTMNATHYHADYVNPKWSRSMIRLIQVDTHIAYREEPETSASL